MKKITKSKKEVNILKEVSSKLNTGRIQKTQKVEKKKNSPKKNILEEVVSILNDRL
jgi:hypothetical protein